MGGKGQVWKVSAFLCQFLETLSEEGKSDDRRSDRRMMTSHETAHDGIDTERKNAVKMYIAGGAARDLLLGSLTTHDYDVVIYGTLEEDVEYYISALTTFFLNATPDVKVKKLPSKISCCRYTNIYKIDLRKLSLRFDITFVIAEESSSAPLHMTPETYLRSDALRRDFTINSLYIDAEKFHEITNADTTEGEISVMSEDDKIPRGLGTANYTYKEVTLTPEKRANKAVDILMSDSHIYTHEGHAMGRQQSIRLGGAGNAKEGRIVDVDLFTIDPTGLGLNDIRDRVLRCPIDPLQTLSSDPVRIVRLARFLSMWPDMTIEPGLMEAAKSQAVLSSLQADARLRGEIVRLLNVKSNTVYTHHPGIQLLNQFPGVLSKAIEVLNTGVAADYTRQMRIRLDLSCELYSRDEEADSLLRH